MATGQGSSYRIVIPTFTESEKGLGINISASRTTTATDGLVVYSVDVITPFKSQYHTDVKKVLLRDDDRKNGKISVFVSMKKQEIFFRGITVVLTLYDTCGKKKKLSYLYANENKATAKNEQTDLSESERLELSEILHQSTGIIELPKEANGSSEKTIDPPQRTESKYEIIRRYQKALLSEAGYAQRKGKVYKVSNGRYIGAKNGIFNYVFDLEAELYLSDDTPVTIDVNSITSGTGSVLYCQNFEIVLSLEQNIGTSIASAVIHVEPWKILVKIHDRIGKITSTDRRAVDILEQPKKNYNADIRTIPMGYEKVLQHMLNEPQTVVWGPPGTGKTYALAQAAIQNMKKGKKVLIVAHSNVSVDGVIKKVAELLREHGEEVYLRDGHVLRYGFVRDKELQEDPYASAYNYTLSHYPVEAKRIKELQEAIKNAGKGFSMPKIDLIKKLNEYNRAINDKQKEYLSSAEIIATTVSKLVMDSYFADRQYDTVMFDEISMAYIPHIFAAASYATDYFVAVGDFRQLSPISESPEKEFLDKDYFDYLGITDSSGKLHGHPWLVMLNEQRRMYPDISGFPNKYVYNNLLKDHPSVIENRKGIVEKEPFAGNAMNLINLHGMYCVTYKDDNNSRFNVVSAAISFLLALKTNHEREDSVGIITPYAAETRLIRAMQQDCGEENSSNIAFATVHQFQGSERDTIIFDSVESYPQKKAGWLMSKESDSVLRLINVAVTRSRGKFIAIANDTFWQHKFEDSNNLFYKLLRHLKQNGNVIDHSSKKLSEFIEDLPKTRNLRFYSSIKASFDVFMKDLNKASEKILVIIPDGKLDSVYASQILETIERIKKTNSNVKILMKTNKYAALPEAWKKYCFGTDEVALFPLILIDDKVCWYGYPCADNAFQDNDWSFKTMLPVTLRITGSKTIEILKMLANLEYRKVKEFRVPLIPKGNEQDPNHNVNLSEYIAKTMKCPTCGHNLMLASPHGKPFIKCSSSSCKYTQLLTVDIVNGYLDRSNARCPVNGCNAELQARLGPYGVYVRCDNGHQSSPTKI